MGVKVKNALLTDSISECYKFSTCDRSANHKNSGTAFCCPMCSITEPALNSLILVWFLRLSIRKFSIMRALFLFLFLFAGLSVRAQVLTEEQKIQSLIAYLEGLDKAVFIRNGEEYTSKQAGRFLREKWKRKADKVKTAKEFIIQCASYSGTSGKPYQVKLPDGKIVNTQELLAKELMRIEASCSPKSTK